MLTIVADAYLNHGDTCHYYRELVLVLMSMIFEGPGLNGIIYIMDALVKRGNVCNAAGVVDAMYVTVFLFMRLR